MEYTPMATKIWPVPLALAVSLAALGLTACGGDQPQQQQQGGMPPAPVTVAEVDSENVTYFGEYAARVRGAREVEIAAQVSGILQERRFDEGTEVEEGETLFQIDPEPYEIQLATARAALSDAESANRQAQSEWDRVSGLFERDAVSRRDFEQAQSNRDTAQASVARARAALQDAERNLRYTRVESPVNGMAGSERVTVGNLIQSGMTLTHVTQVDPIRVHFSMPESDAFRHRSAHNNESADDVVNKAWAILPDGSEYAEVGEINFIDPRIDEQSGSVAIRAEFSNAERQLIPGQFIRVRVVVGQYDDVFMIEPTAVSQSRDGAQVFVLDGDAKVRAQPVELGPVIDGRQLIINGLSSGDQLVINGHVALRDGADVQVTNQGNGES
ncbi:efflux transporter periplasmic adaptor subunit [Aliidiomarina soli]|uniref:Efflux transporter periplasmic adaptor subunit n=2 Tax=Aliidiomarina soli TaxID=1928574 RepID=A0A432WM24_9GAMM|nr:efflux transporter periplasmic adaptor subunit [Aliidiomarina soli]